VNVTRRELDRGKGTLRSRIIWVAKAQARLNPILRAEAAASRRISQMQAFWRLTGFTVHTLYADHSQKSTICPHFPGFSVPKRAHLEVIGTDGLATSMRHASRSFGDQADGSVELARPCDTSVDMTSAPYPTTRTYAGVTHECCVDLERKMA
jgi:hypothetical protein